MPSLTHRQRTILALLATHKTSEIAKRLGISKTTVNMDLRKVCVALKCKRLELVHLVVTGGLNLGGRGG